MHSKHGLSDHETWTFRPTLSEPLPSGCVLTSYPTGPQVREREIYPIIIFLEGDEFLVVHNYVITEMADSTLNWPFP